MTVGARVALLTLLIVGAVRADGVASGHAQPQHKVFAGACYCRASGTLHCTADLTERECQRRCDEELCDDWFWRERLPCWNWGYGG